MRRLLPLLLAPVLPLCGQNALVSVIRQPRATAAEFTVPFTDMEVRNSRDQVRLHVGMGLGLRHWDDGDTSVRLVADASTAVNALFAGVGVIIEAPPGEAAFVGPRLRMGWAFHPRWALSLEGEHLERPFADGLAPRRRSSLGLAVTVRF